MVKNTSKINYSLKEKILKLLIENKRIWSILEISKELNVDYKNTFQAVKELYPKFLYKNKKGSLNLIEIKPISDIFVFGVENKRKQEFLEKNSKAKLIKEDIEKINYPFVIVLIFGSAVKNTSTSHSDIDICIISDNKEKTRKIISNLNLLPYKMEIQEFTTEEFESMFDKKENNLAKEITKNNIILFGSENYYNLIEEWMKKE